MCVAFRAHSPSVVCITMTMTHDVPHCKMFYGTSCRRPTPWDDQCVRREVRQVIDAGAPALARRLLGTELQKYRKEAGRSGSSVEDECGWSKGRVSRIEGGKYDTVPIEDVRRLLTIYKVPVEKHGELEDMARAMDGHEWVQQHGKDIVSPALRTLVAAESVARCLYCHENEVVAGLLQTEAYAYAVLRARWPKAPNSEIERRVKVRVERQRILTRKAPEPPHIYLILDEGVLRRTVGGPKVMREQIRRLLSVSNHPEAVASIQIMPFTAGAHPLMFGTYSVMEFPDPVTMPTVAIEEGHTGSLIRESSKLIERYLDTWHLGAKAALGLDESSAMLRDYAAM